MADRSNHRMAPPAGRHQLPDYPLIFRTTHVVRRAAYEALIRVDGRLLMALEDGEWVCSGVEPGGLLETGAGANVAYEVFRLGLRRALDGLAESSDTLAEFRSNAEVFFATDEVEEARWNSALEALRRGSIPLDDAFSLMHRVPPRESRIDIHALVDHSSEPIERDDIALPEAA